MGYRVWFPKSKWCWKTSSWRHVLLSQAFMVAIRLPLLLSCYVWLPSSLAALESFPGHVCLLCPISWQMLHLRRYSSGTILLGPSLTIGGLEHLLLLCPGCPHLLHDCVVVLSEDEACRPSIGRPDCLLVCGVKTTRAAMSDGTTHEEGWPTGIIGTEYASISVSLL